MGKNLWGSFEDILGDVKAPKVILEEQSGYLEESTNHIIKGRIQRRKVQEYRKIFYESININCDFYFAYIICSDYVENYSYELCKIAYGIKMYPLAISFDNGIIEDLHGNYELVDGDTVIVNEEGMLIDVLGDAFTSKEVRQVLRGLRAIAQNEKEKNDDFLF